MDIVAFVFAAMALVALGFVLLVIAAATTAVLRHRRRLAREREMAGAAQRLGFRFMRSNLIQRTPFALFLKPVGGAGRRAARSPLVAKALRSIEERFGMPLLPEAPMQAAAAMRSRWGNFLEGSHRGAPVVVFDFWYWEDVVGNGPLALVRRYRRFTGAAIDTGAAWPHLVVDRETAATRMRAALGMRDIELEWEAFNRAFLIDCPDRRFAHAFLDARMMEFLMGCDSRLRFEALGRWLLAWTMEVPSEQLGTLLDVLAAFRDQVPAVAASLAPPA